MDDNAMYKMPTIDFSAKSLLTLSQLGIFAVFAYWAVEGGVEDNFQYLFLVMMAGAGLALFLSVPNARMGVTLGIPALMVMMGVAIGEYDMIFWAGFMMVMMVQLAGFAIEGEATDEDNDGTEFTMVLDSTQQTIAQGGLALGVIGVLVFTLTALVGTDLGPMRPWHGGAMAAGAMLIARYLWSVAEGAPAASAGDYLMVLSMVGLLVLTPCVAYDANSGSSDSEE
jgi:hypothetical protein